jgi:hypothetical protein
MIYLQLSDGRDLLILEPGNLERLKQGKMGTTPDGRIAIAYTPDMPWLASEMTKAAKDGRLDANTLAALIEESHKREPVFEREHHPPHEVIRNGQIVREDA